MITREIYTKTLAKYAPPLLETIVQRATRYATNHTELEPIARLHAVLSDEELVAKLVVDLEPAERRALAVFRSSPYVAWRWDNAVRLLSACGVDMPYEVLQRLLNEGLLSMAPTTSQDALARFEVHGAARPEGLPVVALASPLGELKLDLPAAVPTLSGKPSAKGFRQTDGWEFPLRLAVLWQLARRLPIKRTQMNQLFKRDQERIGANPLLSTAMLDAPVLTPETGMLVYAIAMGQGWLPALADEQSPQTTLDHVWPPHLHDLLLSCAASLVGVEWWNELGAETPVGVFRREVASARYLILLWMATLGSDQGATVEQLARRLQKVHAPWNATGELIGSLRNTESRAQLARDWIKQWVFGPLYQVGLVAVGQSAEGDLLARLTPLGYRFVGRDAVLDAPLAYPQTLLAQPNHQVVVYRQGMTVELLSQIVAFAEPKSLGAALSFEINADSVYLGLEAGLAPDRMIAVLEQHGSRALPSGLAESIRTWAAKRSRLCVYASASLFEFADEKDMREALARGLEGIPITDRMVLVPEEKDGAFKNLRITAARDYNFDAEQCVESGPDGIMLKVDLTKSDLMLESELRRFAEPVQFRDRNGRQQFRVTADSLRRAFEQGLGVDYLEEWFRRRTGGDPPPSVRLLCRAVAAADMTARRQVVVRTESPIITDGLLQHPLTAELFHERLGPTALTVLSANTEKLREALADLGIKLDLQDM